MPFLHKRYLGFRIKSIVNTLAIERAELITAQDLRGFCELIVAEKRLSKSVTKLLSATMPVHIKTKCSNGTDNLTKAQIITLAALVKIYLSLYEPLAEIAYPYEADADVTKTKENLVAKLLAKVENGDNIKQEFTMHGLQVNA